MRHRMPNGVKNLQAFEAGGKKFIRLDGYGVFEFENVSVSRMIYMLNDV